MTGFLVIGGFLVALAAASSLLARAERADPVTRQRRALDGLERAVFGAREEDDA